VELISDNSISRAALKQIAERSFGNLVKAVVDVQMSVMAIDAELHADQEAFLLSGGSRQQDLWGINLYPDAAGDAFVEFDSMINLRPSQGNRSRGVESPDMREKIIAIVNRLVR
jgi:hypothetical protein